MYSANLLLIAALLVRPSDTFRGSSSRIKSWRSSNLSEKNNGLGDFFGQAFGSASKQAVVADDEEKKKPKVAFDDGIPSNGIIEYIGRTVPTDGGNRWETDDFNYVAATPDQLFWTKFSLWRQLPWKKIKGKVILKAKIGGALPLDKAQQGFSLGARPDFEVVGSLEELITMFNYASHDPRIQAVFLEIDRVGCGYAKLQELRRIMAYFRQSGKEIIAYSSGGAEKELYIGLGCDAFYVPPDGGLDLRGFSAAATFVRGIFDKIGIEPQVQRIGKYKSFGDTFNRTSISEAQREVISSLLMEASDFWADSVASSLNKTTAEVIRLWSETGIKTPYDHRDFGLVTGVKYMDQVEDILADRYRKEIKPSIMESFAKAFNLTAARMAQDAREVLAMEFRDGVEDFDLKKEFAIAPRRNSTKIAAEKALAAAALAASKAKATSAEGSSPSDSSSTSSSTSQAAAAATANIAVPEIVNGTIVSVTLTAGEAVFREKVKSSWRKMKEMQKRRLAATEGSFLPGGMYLKKMRKGWKILKGLALREVRSGPRVAVINAIGGINTGKSSQRGPTGRSLGSDTLISQVRRVKADPGVRAVVIRVDSPGGSALASDLMWREIRALAREKPVVASMVDVAASGGYYIAMACDEIVAEELTITGSIGVVSSKFNLKELNSKIGYTVENLSRGRYAEVLSSNRGFTEEEEKYFEESARKAYSSFITKAAASRSLSVEDMNEVAQGRVWTGRQALERGLVDHMGGLTKALRVAYEMSDLPPVNETKGLLYETIQEFRGGIPFFGGGAAGSLLSYFTAGSSSGFQTTAATAASGEPMALCDDSVAGTGLVGADTLGVKPVISALGLDPLLSYALSHSPLGGAAMAAIEMYVGTKTKSSAMATGDVNMANVVVDKLSNVFESVVDAIEEIL